VGPFLSAFAVSFGVVFVAELGDKSQLITIALSSRYRWTVILAGITIAGLVMHGLAVLVGGTVQEVVPERVLQLAAALAFFVFGLLNLRRPPPSAEAEEEAEAAELVERAGRARRNAVLGIAVAFSAAEFGDKTQLATLTLASTWNPVGVWLGATAGMSTANLLGLGIGVLLGKHLPERTMQVGASVLFFVFGAVLLLQALTG
jgi:putative Ca2+/H+ antiporter (TMEM165/GDT1 family)